MQLGTQTLVLANHLTKAKALKVATVMPTENWTVGLNWHPTSPGINNNHAESKSPVWCIKCATSNPDELASKFWQLLEDVPFDDEDLSVEWMHFQAGASRTEIWHWFEEIFNVNIADFLGASSASNNLMLPIHFDRAIAIKEEPKSEIF